MGASTDSLPAPGFVLRNAAAVTPQGLYSIQVLFLGLSQIFRERSSPLFRLPLGRQGWKEGDGAKERVLFAEPW